MVRRLGRLVHDLRAARHLADPGRVIEIRGDDLNPGGDLLHFPRTVYHPDRFSSFEEFLCDGAPDRAGAQNNVLS
jgi:hypothetical protein